jgi:hypothetical protein
MRRRRKLSRRTTLLRRCHSLERQARRRDSIRKPHRASTWRQRERRKSVYTSSYSIVEAIAGNGGISIV